MSAIARVTLASCTTALSCYEFRTVSLYRVTRWICAASIGKSVLLQTCQNRGISIEVFYTPIHGKGVDIFLAIDVPLWLAMCRG